MTDPNTMTADEIEALANNATEFDWENAIDLQEQNDWELWPAKLIAAAPALALRLAAVLRENERLRESIESAIDDLRRDNALAAEGELEMALEAQ